MTNEVTAKDETYRVFAVTLGTFSDLGYTPKVYWENLKDKDIPAPDKFHIRVFWHVIDTSQSAFASCGQDLTKKIYDTEGFVSFEIYAPMCVPNSDNLSHKLAEHIRQGFRNVSTPGGVWFRDARILRVSPEDLFWRRNVVVETNFSEVA